MVPRKRCFRLASVRLGEAQYLMNSDGRIGYDSAELEMNVLPSGFTFQSQFPFSRDRDLSDILIPSSFFATIF